MEKPKYLIFVEAGAVDHNKFYNMFPNADGNSFKVEYGRVGAKTTTMEYSMYDWSKKLNEKLKKGYTDVSDLKEDLIEETSTTAQTVYKPISNASVRAIVEKLQSLARDAVQKNYTVKASAVTQAMVDKAQEKINELTSLANILSPTLIFNRELQNLFMIIPRKMDSVGHYLATSTDQYESIIDREQKTLDIMQGQIYVPSQTIPDTDNSTTHEITVLEENGLIMEEGTAEDIALVKKLMDAHGSNSSYHFRKVWKVTNTRTQPRFDNFVKANNIKETKLLWHGSRTENFWSIMKMGLVLRPKATRTGSMFGSLATYFAPKCQKSIGYTSLGGSYWAGGNDKVAYMALFDVAYGKPYNVYSFDSAYYDMDYNKLQRMCPGANCLHAHGGTGMLRNDEIVVYKEEQTTIKYLIEIA